MQMTAKTLQSCLLIQAHSFYYISPVVCGDAHRSHMIIRKKATIMCFGAGSIELFFVVGGEVDMQTLRHS